MSDQSDKKIPEKLYQRRSGFSIFDFYKNPGWRLGTGSAVKGPAWYISVVLSFALGFWSVWADITGGAGIARIFIVWMVVSGVAFYFFIRLQLTLFWSALVAAGGAVLALVLQLRYWFLNQGWPGWAVKDLPIISDMLGETPAESLMWLSELSAILALAAACLVFLILTLISRRF